MQHGGANVLTDETPEGPEHQWVGKTDKLPQKIRIGFSCPKTISSMTMRNSIRFQNWNVKQFVVKVREPNSALWVSFINGSPSNPKGQNPVPLETFTGTAITAMEVEFSCLNAFANGEPNRRCALNYLTFA